MKAKFKKVKTAVKDALRMCLPEEKLQSSIDFLQLAMSNDNSGQRLSDIAMEFLIKRAIVSPDKTICFEFLNGCDVQLVIRYTRKKLNHQ